MNCASSETQGSTCGHSGKVHELRGTCVENALAGSGVGGQNCGGFLGVRNRIDIAVGCRGLRTSTQ